MYELIYRTGRLFGRLFHPLTCYRAWCGGSIAGRIYRTLRFAWRLLVLRPATLAGLVLVVTFLYQKMHGTAVPYWQGVLLTQAASYQGAPAGFVMRMSGCLTEKTTSQEAAVSLLPEPDCEPRRVAVNIVRVAQSDIAVFTAFYITLVVLSFIWMGLSGQVMPVATEKGEKGGRAGSANMRSSRSQIIHTGDSIVVVTPEGEYHTLFVDKAGHLVATGNATSGTEEDR
ncbi:hypothetical protein ACU60U_20330 [Klebsiella aerogenes]